MRSRRPGRLVTYNPRPWRCVSPVQTQPCRVRKELRKHWTEEDRGIDGSSGKQGAEWQGRYSVVVKAKRSECSDVKNMAKVRVSMTDPSSTRF